MADTINSFDSAAAVILCLIMPVHLQKIDCFLNEFHFISVFTTVMVDFINLLGEIQEDTHKSAGATLSSLLTS
jgi:hypothetical protein